MAIKRIEGRTGEMTEFVEFQVDTPRMNFVCQRGMGNHWWIFRVSRQVGGSVVTLENFPLERKQEAVAFAQNMAEAAA